MYIILCGKLFFIKRWSFMFFAEIVVEQKNGHGDT